MSGNKTSSVDADHEIQEFLQKCIIEKINFNNDEQTTEIKSDLDNIKNNISSTKASTDTIGMDISSLKEQVEEISELVTELEQKSNTIISLERGIRTNLPNDETITSSIVNELSGFEKNSIIPIKEDLVKCRDEVHRLNDVLEQLSQLSNLLNNTNGAVQNNYEKQCEEFSSLSEANKLTMEKMGKWFETLDEKGNYTNSQIAEIQSSEQRLNGEINDISKTLRMLWLVSALNIIFVIILVVLYIT